MDADLLAFGGGDDPDAVLSIRVRSWVAGRGDGTSHEDGLVAAGRAVVVPVDRVARGAAGTWRTDALSAVGQITTVAADGRAGTRRVALVHQVRQLLVAVRKAVSLADDSCQFDVVGDDRRHAVAAEIESSGVHEGAEVVLYSQRTFGILDKKIIFLARNDGIFKDGDVRVPIASPMLMPEAECWPISCATMPSVAQPEPMLIL